MYSGTILPFYKYERVEYIPFSVPDTTCPNTVEPTTATAPPLNTVLIILYLFHV